MIFFGPPGAGKGTQAKIISELLNIAHLSTGDILRKKLLEQDKLANELKVIMSSGNLVSDDILNSIASYYVIHFSCLDFFIDNTYYKDNKSKVFIKIMYEPRSEKVLGIIYIGESAAEIIQSLAIVFQKNLYLDDLKQTIPVHPTSSEELVTII